MQLILVAPLSAPETPEESVETPVRLSGSSDQFRSRSSQVSELTTFDPDPVEWRKNFEDTEYGITYAVRSCDVYRQISSVFIVMTVEVEGLRAILEDRSRVIDFEYSTNNLIEAVIKDNMHPDCEGRAVKWVNRTLALDKWSEELTKYWFQQRPDLNCSPVGEGRFVFYAAWGNNILVTSGREVPNKFASAMVLSQFLWDNLNVIDFRSREVLERSQPGIASPKGALLTDVIDLNYDLAVHSIYYERIFVEADPFSRDITSRVLQAWDYERSSAYLETRLQRLENILNARSELYRRRFEDNRRRAGLFMEVVLFFIALTTFLSIGLAVIQTAFTGPVEGYPEGAVMEWIRDYRNADALIWGLCLILVTLGILFSWLYVRTMRRRDK